MAAGGDRNGPRAAPSGQWPFRGHRTLAEADADTAIDGLPRGDGRRRALIERERARLKARMSELDAMADAASIMTQEAV